MQDKFVENTQVENKLPFKFINEQKETIGSIVEDLGKLAKYLLCYYRCLFKSWVPQKQIQWQGVLYKWFIKEVFPGETIKELEEAGQERGRNRTNGQILGSFSLFQKETFGL